MRELVSLTYYFDVAPWLLKHFYVISAGLGGTNYGDTASMLI